MMNCLLQEQQKLLQRQCWQNFNQTCFKQYPIQMEIDLNNEQCMQNNYVNI
jgi:hypothetical protein